jgi:hypothetical protein
MKLATFSFALGAAEAEIADVATSTNATAVAVSTRDLCLMDI